MRDLREKLKSRTKTSRLVDLSHLKVDVSSANQLPSIGGRRKQNIFGCSSHTARKRLNGSRSRVKIDRSKILSDMKPSG